MKSKSAITMTASISPFYLPLNVTFFVGGDDFYEWFLGPRMIYTSGIVTSIDTPTSLEQLQDNKLAVVCSKLDLQPTDRLLDVGCG
jgi:cyclopropane fatty-acyl-phospholipid synthase-like methyltransferase